MKPDYFTAEERQGKKFYLKLHTQAKGAAWMWQAIGAVCGLVIGLVAFIFGSVFTVIGWIASPGTIGLFLGEYGVVMFLIGVPLLIIGAHCLDLLEGKDKPVSISINGR